MNVYILHCNNLNVLISIFNTERRKGEHVERKICCDALLLGNILVFYLVFRFWPMDTATKLVISDRKGKDYFMYKYYHGKTLVE